MLADLDELVLKCRDERARAYIREAVACCKVGAYRSAIVSTWIAVVFDIIDKIRELTLSGDKQAAQLIENYDEMVRLNDFARALNFERTLLDVAKSNFELISEQEFTDLDRLRLDRHRCAHPSHVSPAEVFTPPAELARVHIRSAVDYLLQYEPAQGKAALEGLMTVISSEYFARRDEDALTVLSKTPLKRARRSLVRNFMLILIKNNLNAESIDPQWFRNRRALICVKKLHPETWAEVLTQELTRLYRNLPEARLKRGVEVLAIDESLSHSLEPDQIVRLRTFTSNLRDDLELLDDLLDIPPLAGVAKRRVGSLGAKDVRDLGLAFIPTLIKDRMVQCYVNARNYDDANLWGSAVVAHARSLEATDARAILEAAATNDEILYSFRLSDVLGAIRGEDVIPAEEIDQLEANITKAREVPAG